MRVTSQANQELRQALTTGSEAGALFQMDVILTGVKTKLKAQAKQVAALPDDVRPSVEAIHRGAMEWLTQQNRQQEQRHARVR